MKTNLLLVAAALTLLLSACKKDKDNEPYNDPAQTDWYKYTLKIEYNSDSISEVTREEWTYDSTGRPTGRKEYNLGVLNYQNRDYVYNGDEVTYYEDFFGGGITVSTKYKLVNQLEWVRLRERAVYQPDGVTIKERQLATYDTDNKITSSKMERNGELYAAMRDITYNGSVVSYFYDRYNDSVVTGTGKYETGFYDGWVKVGHDVIYQMDNVTEYVRIQNTYDADGRLVNVKRYNQGVLDTEDKDFSYSGNEATYKMYDYDNGVLMNVTKYKIVYFNR